MLRLRPRSTHSSLTLTADAAYALWAEVYPPHAHNALMASEESAVEAVLSTLEARRVLDLGTGTGRGLRLLSSLDPARATGLDRARAMLMRARQAGAPLVQGDACALPFKDASFDVVLSCLMVGDIEDLTPWAREVARVLEPGGHLVYSDFHPHWRARGWTRTFRARDGRLYALPIHPHSIAHHREALTAAGFEPLLVQELVLPADGRPETEAMRARWNDPTIGVVIHARHAVRSEPADRASTSRHSASRSAGHG